MGVDRTLLACDAEGVFLAPDHALDAFIIDVTDGFAALRIADTLRTAGFRVDRAFDGRSMKAQMKVADRSGAHIAIIIGSDEAAALSCTVRDLKTSEQRLVLEADLVENLSALVGSRTPRRTTL
jgi:histidyl-tRNA synthetase